VHQTYYVNKILKLNGKNHQRAAMHSIHSIEISWMHFKFFYKHCTTEKKYNTDI